MRAKIITFKPCKSGETTIYLEKGIDLRGMIDLIGKEVTISEVQDESAGEMYDNDTKVILDIIKTYGDKMYQRGLLSLETNPYKDGIKEN